MPSPSRANPAATPTAGAASAVTAPAPVVRTWRPDPQSAFPSRGRSRQGPRSPTRPSIQLFIGADGFDQSGVGYRREVLCGASQTVRAGSGNGVHKPSDDAFPSRRHLHRRRAREPAPGGSDAKRSLRRSRVDAHAAAATDTHHVPAPSSRDRPRSKFRRGAFHAVLLPPSITIPDDTTSRGPSARFGDPDDPARVRTECCWAVDWIGFVALSEDGASHRYVLPAVTWETRRAPAGGGRWCYARLVCAGCRGPDAKGIPTGHLRPSVHHTAAVRGLHPRQLHRLRLWQQASALRALGSSPRLSSPAAWHVAQAFALSRPHANRALAPPISTARFPQSMATAGTRAREGGRHGLLHARLRSRLQRGLVDR
ncbi:hypothetical protein BN946_scf184862.g4 [Trametes cinnabarina]|uniref:Uncharacterized protein n=1 Tax=Pycnoporus cinnabarinus TaxID=5643 RepID=A0A060SJB7_PYCCI|nr:hypothetical protein BN946_scf184862.g4 [Trametes cinnabarina]